MGKLKRNISKCSIWREYLLIFVCTGSRSYQFDRLIKALDELVEKKEIDDEMFAQIGEGNYLPKHFNYKRYLDNEEFQHYQDKSHLIITHGGTGSIVGALKKGKYVIGVPRLHRYGEHIDNHQLQIVDLFANEGFIQKVDDVNNLSETIHFFDDNPKMHTFNLESNILGILIDYIETH